MPSPTRVAMIRRRYAETDMTVREIAAEFDYNERTIYRVIRGMVKRTRGTPPVVQEQIVKLYQEGWSARRIAWKFGRGTTTVFDILRRRGVLRRRPCRNGPLISLTREVAA